MSKNSVPITQLVRDARLGNKAANDKLFEEIYPALKRIAKSQIRRMNNQLTINTTAVVHEVYIRFFHENEEIKANDRVHFYAMMATAMRWYLLESIRTKKSQKRGQNAIHISLDQIGIGTSNSLVDILTLDTVLNELGEKNPRLLQIVQLRCFCGMSIEEAAEMMSISPATAKRDWKLATTWLGKRLNTETEEAA